MSEEIARDLALLEAVERGAPPLFRTWTCARPTVVVGMSLTIESEVETDYCARQEIPVLRRRSGGGAVLIGPGTLQYAFVLPYSLHEDLRQIRSAKALCNDLLIEALARPGLGQDVSGDLVLGDRKAGGLAMRRRRLAMLLHGTLLLEADLEMVGRTLRHPSREPDYRHSRGHGDFLCNLGPVDRAALESRIQTLLLELAE